jgi:hypothetical protein
LEAAGDIGAAMLALNTALRIQPDHAGALSRLEDSFGSVTSCRLSNASTNHSQTDILDKTTLRMVALAEQALWEGNLSLALRYYCASPLYAASEFFTLGTMTGNFDYFNRSNSIYYVGHAASEDLYKGPLAVQMIEGATQKRTRLHQVITAPELIPEDECSWLIALGEKYAADRGGWPVSEHTLAPTTG